MQLTDIMDLNERLYSEWSEYYGDRAEQELRSFIQYKEMIFYEHIDRYTGEEITGEIAQGTTLEQYFLGEMDAQLEMDQDQQYMEKELY